MNEVQIEQTVSSQAGPPRVEVNPAALVGVIFGTTTLMYAAGKKPPKLLLLAGLLISGITLARDVSSLVDKK